MTENRLADRQKDWHKDRFTNTDLVGYKNIKTTIERQKQ